MERPELRALGLLGLAWAALWLLTVPVGNFPLNDDWVYALGVRSVLETGRYALPSPATANVFTQVYWGALFCLPFGFSFTALRISTFVIGATGILATFLLLRELGADRRLAALGALTLAVNPLYLSLSTSFMTDVPFTALITASLWLYVRSVNRESHWSFFGALALAYAAILIRQFALMLPLAFAVAHIARKGFGIRALLIAALPVVIGVVTQLLFERWVLSTGRTPTVVSPVASLMPTNVRDFTRIALAMTISAVPYLGCFLTPFVIGVVSVRGFTILRSRPIAALIGSVVVAEVLLAILGPRGAVLPSLGNILMRTGIGPLTLSDTFLLHRNVPELPRALKWLWPIATVWSVFVTALMLVMLGATLPRFMASVRQGRNLRPAWAHLLLSTASVAYAIGLFLLGNQSFWFDRYLIPFIPLLLGLLSLAVHDRPPRWSVLPAAALGLYALFSVVGTHDYLAWNRARWRASAFLEKNGVGPRQIDGGYEYYGWLLYDPKHPATLGKSFSWVIANDFMITNGAVQGYREVALFPYHRWMSLGSSQVYAMRREQPLSGRPN